MSSSSLALISTSTLISQGAEAGYRHPTLNSSLTRSRVAGEARALLKCLSSGVNVPGVRMVDSVEGSVRKLLPGGAEEEDDDQESEPEVVDLLKEYGVSVRRSPMHLADVIHGDLTTSNMILRPPSTSIFIQASSLLISAPDLTVPFSAEKTRGRDFDGKEMGESTCKIWC
ncbi:hypothetical protein B0H16DRAFT_1463523 [Mycena metata]|uniref:non-specific serine/threonine protein kinase n=1 Tax=Mycena metata TaxID=1033252 RepID=A0AAD7ILA0_9AGAR|nr:hypothetical protein B0H16DRAFT_1463523 [Mycena metata]